MVSRLLKAQLSWALAFAGLILTVGGFLAWVYYPAYIDYDGLIAGLGIVFLVVYLFMQYP